MIVKATHHLDNYSEEMIVKFVKDIVGKPVRNPNGVVIGEVLSASRIPNTNRVETTVYAVSKSKYED